MYGGAAATAIDAVLDALMRDLSDHIISLYLYGSLSGGLYQAGQSDINLLIVVDDEITIHEVRYALRPVWCKYMPVLKRTPLITTRATLSRHLSFNPGLANHLFQYSTILAGQPALPDPPTLESVEHLAQMARISMHASAATAPSLLSDRESAESVSNLRSLTRQLFGIEVREEERATLLLGQLQADILRRLEQHPSLLWKDRRVPDAPPLVSDLRAIYERESRLILLLPDLGPDYVADRITYIDWNAVASRIMSQYRGLWVTTPAQLRLILQYDSPSDYQLRSYNHAWGLDPIADLPLELWRTFRSFGRHPSTLLVDTLPQAYISSEDSDLTMLVHDLQNQLLNVQLQSELFSRIKDRPITKPPEPLPDRTLQLETRIDGIYEHLNWWSEHYHTHMTEALDQSN